MIDNERFPPLKAKLLNSQFQSEEKGYTSDISLLYDGLRFKKVSFLLGKIGLATVRAERKQLGPFTLSGIGTGQVIELAPNQVLKSMDSLSKDWRNHV